MKSVAFDSNLRCTFYELLSKVMEVTIANANNISSAWPVCWNLFTREVNKSTYGRIESLVNEFAC